jgi:hypothetical protein
MGKLTRRSFLKSTGLSAVLVSSGFGSEMFAAKEVKKEIHVYAVPVKVYDGVLVGTDIAICSHTTFYEEGTSPEDVVAKLKSCPNFLDNYNRMSPENRKGRMPYVLRDEEIKQEPDCEIRYTNGRGEFICGECENPELERSSGIYGMCVLEVYDPPENLGCPYDD